MGTNLEFKAVLPWLPIKAVLPINNCRSPVLTSSNQAPKEEDKRRKKDERTKDAIDIEARP
jgi:hypothetical protein